MNCHPDTETSQQFVIALILYMTMAAMAPALAVDGVIEINQARALAGGVTPGDVSGFPVTIAQPGSYRLTSNLDIRQQPTPEDVTAIKIEVDDVSIDLNGFSLLGPTLCGGSPLTCTPPIGTGRGIDGENQSRLSVINGRVVGMGSHGVILGPRSRIKEVIAMHNNRIGLRASFSSNVTGCIAEANGHIGIITGQASVISGNTANANKADGIFSASLSIVLNNTASLNGQNGITTENDASVIGNNVAGNDNDGLYLSTGTGYVNNVANGNFGLQEVEGGVQMGVNICGGDTTCP